LDIIWRPSLGFQSPVMTTGLFCLMSVLLCAQIHLEGRSRFFCFENEEETVMIAAKRTPSRRPLRDRTQDQTVDLNQGQPHKQGQIVLLCMPNRTNCIRFILTASETRPQEP
jgi:hypothetical protein